MDINTADGEQVRFTNENGYERERTHAASILEVGVPYTVKYVNVENFSSTVQLVEFPGKHFNTVMFENVNEDYRTRNWWEEARLELYNALEQVRSNY